MEMEMKDSVSRAFTWHQLKLILDTNWMFVPMRFRIHQMVFHWNGILGPIILSWPNAYAKCIAHSCVPTSQILYDSRYISASLTSGPTGFMKAFPTSTLHCNEKLRIEEVKGQDAAWLRFHQWHIRCNSHVLTRQWTGEKKLARAVCSRGESRCC